MSLKIHRLPLIIGAAICWIAAAVWIALAGLPDRAVYSGQILADGRWVAPEIGAFAPPFQAQTLTSRVALETLRGSAVVLNFWATWCVPCAVEMPELEALHKSLPAVQVIAINLGEAPDAVRAWAEQHDLTFTLAFDPDGTIAQLYALRGQPMTYIIAPSGEIRSIFFGATSEIMLREALLPLLS